MKTSPDIRGGGPPAQRSGGGVIGGPTTPSRPISLYVHWPYCSRICPYCDFNVTRDRGQASQRALFEAILRDLTNQARAIGPRRLVSIFFGGGTPSLLPPGWVGELIAEAKALLPADPHGVEITLEANPTDAEIGRFTDFRAAGVNRLSLGVQSLNDSELTFLGRNHGGADALRGIETAQAVFGRVSVDLIYALPAQTPEAWREALTRVAGLGVEHISPYQLTIESTTAFGRAVARGRWSPPGEDLAGAFFDVTQTTLAELGFDAYEVSNHARGKAAQSTHNVSVWRGNEYIGIGPGAHGRLNVSHHRVATTALSDLKAYGAAENPGHTEALSALEAEEELVMLGLRMSEGIALDRFSLLDLRAKSAPLVADGFMAADATHLRATAKGRVVLDRLLFELLS